MAEDVETGLGGFGRSLDGRGEVVNAPSEARIGRAIHDRRERGGRDRLAGGHWSQGLNQVTGWTGWRVEVVNDVRQVSCYRRLVRSAGEAAAESTGR